MTDPTQEQVERLAAKFHAIYQQEAIRQNDIRHANEYDKLAENTKEYDRVLARYVLSLLLPAVEALRRPCDCSGLKRRHNLLPVCDQEKALSKLREAGVTE